MSLHRLLFDTTDLTTADLTSNVGAYLRMGVSGQLATYHSHVQASLGSFDFVDGDVNVGDDTVTETSHGFNTGDVVQLTTTGTLPTGLSTATDYYIIRVDDNTIKFATSLRNAEDGTAVDITAASGGGTHTVTSQEEIRNALDTYILNTVDVSATNLDIRDLSASQDNVAISDGTDTLGINADGSINITDNSGSITVDDGGTSLTVDATDLDIRDLTHVSDSVSIGDGTDLLAVNADGSINITDNGGSLTVDATQLDIDDLNATDDAVQAWAFDGTGNAITSSGGALDINIQSSDIEIDVEDDLADTALAVSAETVNSTSSKLITSDLALRRFVWLYNNNKEIAYIGPSGVATSDGFPLFAGSLLEARIGPNVAIHAVAETGKTTEVRVLQAS